ncbi:MAG: hypothetical protein KBT03_11035 [Bacteroidales bacterium]|nr:hypothetical protein [Candidatus Scybalousia scybalohippi]
MSRLLFNFTTADIAVSDSLFADVNMGGKISDIKAGENAFEVAALDAITYKPIGAELATLNDGRLIVLASGRYIRFKTTT